MTAILIVLAVAAVVFYMNHRSGNPPFWRAVAEHPDLAMQWFKGEQCWTIVRSGQPSPPRTAYTPGFAVFDPETREMVKVHCLADKLDDSQRRFLQSLQVR